MARRTIPFFSWLFSRFHWFRPRKTLKKKGKKINMLTRSSRAVLTSLPLSLRRCASVALRCNLMDSKRSDSYAARVRGQIDVTSESLKFDSGSEETHHELNTIEPVEDEHTSLLGRNVSYVQPRIVERSNMDSKKNDSYAVRVRGDVTSESSKLDSGSEQPHHELKTIKSVEDEYTGLLGRNVSDVQPRIVEPVQGRDLDQVSKETSDLKLFEESHHELKTVEPVEDDHTGLLGRNVSDVQPKIVEPVPGRDLDQLESHHVLKTVEPVEDEHTSLLGRNGSDIQPRIVEPVQGRYLDQLSKETSDLKLVGEPATTQPGNAFAPEGGPRRGGNGLYFRLTESCMLGLQRGDITKWFVDGKTDAIVNAANERMLGGGGVDGAIHRAAGPMLLKACEKLPVRYRNVRCPVGEAVITGGFKLPVSNIIHTVGPIYGRSHDPQKQLADAYRNSLDLAVKNNISYIAFPAISCGVYSYPVSEAAKIALDVVKNSGRSLREVHFVLFEEETWDAWTSEARRSLVEVEQ